MAEHYTSGSGETHQVYAPTRRRLIAVAGLVGLTLASPLARASQVANVLVKSDPKISKTNDENSREKQTDLEHKLQSDLQAIYMDTEGFLQQLDKQKYKKLSKDEMQAEAKYLTELSLHMGMPHLRGLLWYHACERLDTQAVLDTLVKHITPPEEERITAFEEGYAFEGVGLIGCGSSKKVTKEQRKALAEVLQPRKGVPDYINISALRAGALVGQTYKKEEQKALLEKYYRYLEEAVKEPHQLDLRETEETHISDHTLEHLLWTCGSMDGIGGLQDELRDRKLTKDNRIKKILDSGEPIPTFKTVRDPLKNLYDAWKDHGKRQRKRNTWGSVKIAGKEDYEDNFRTMMDATRSDIKHFLQVVAKTISLGEITGMSGNASPGSRTIRLPTNLLKTRDPKGLVASLTHEATHLLDVIYGTYQEGKPSHYKEESPFVTAITTENIMDQSKHSPSASILHNRLIRKLKKQHWKKHW